MRTIDFSPLYRSAVGFDRMAGLLESARSTDLNGWPPYNIEQVNENGYRVEIAVAGFTTDDLSIEMKENELTVSGDRKTTEDGDGHRSYLHRGLAQRNFDLRFQLADYVVVKDARLENGLLSIELARELPEALKPRRIAISSGSAQHIEDRRKAA